MGELAAYNSSNDSSSLMVEDPTGKDRTDDEGAGRAAPKGNCDFDSADDETEENKCSTDCIRSG